MLQTMKQDGVFKSQGVEAAFRAVPRHLFLPHLPLEEVYRNRAIGVKHDRHGLLISSSSQPTMMAIMLNQAQLQPGDNVLEIGTATGYNAAIMQHIVGESGSVTSMELDADLAEQARRNLQRTHYGQVRVVTGDGAQGYAPRAAYDHILATVGVWDVPAAWLQQLKPTGSLIVPIAIDGVQVSAVFRPLPDGSYLSTDNRPCAFVYLRGAFAGPDFRRRINSSNLYILSDQVAELDTAALHSLLSSDHETRRFDHTLDASDYWFGFQLHLMVNEPPGYVFAVFAVIEERTSYGLEGRGIALFTPGSAAFTSYHEHGIAHCYGGADAFLEMQNSLDQWIARSKPQTEQLRLRLIPKALAQSTPLLDVGKVYERRDHILHVWMD